VTNGSIHRPGKTLTGPVVSRETSPFSDCSRCGRPRDLASQRYCKECRAAYMRDWRAAQARGRAQIDEALRRIVILATNLRQACGCPPGAGCAECLDRRRRAAELEEIAGLLAPLARVGPWR
jgi:hypothetical protein